jgi:hypothetical protein
MTTLPIYFMSASTKCRYICFPDDHTSGNGDEQDADNSDGQDADRSTGKSFIWLIINDNPANLFHECFY